MYKNTSYPLRALVLGTLLAATSFGFASANTTTHAPATAVASTKVEASTAASTQAVTINTDVSNVEIGRAHV